MFPFSTPWNYQKVISFLVISEGVKWEHWLEMVRIRRILRISPYSVRMRENADQNNSEYGHFSHSGN